MTSEIFITTCSILLVIGATPGPATLRAATISANQGVVVGLIFTLGVGIGYAAVSLLCNALFSATQEVSYGIALAKKLVGIGLVCWMSLKILTAKPEDATVLSAQVAYGALQHGLVLQFVNPKAWVACFLVFESLDNKMGFAALSAWQIPTLTGAMIFATVSAWVLFGAVIRPLLNNPFRFRVFHSVMGVGLMATVFPMMQF